MHIWGANTQDRPWPVESGGLKPLPPHRPIPITKDSLLHEMAEVGVDRVFVIPPSWEGERNDLVLDAARSCPERFAAVCRVNLSSPDSREQILNWRDKSGMFGIQLTFQTPLNEKPLVEGKIDWAWAAAEESGVPIHMYLPHRHLHYIERAIERHPNLKILINHFALTGGKKDVAAFGEFDKLVAMARFPNVSVKASCLPFYTTEPYPFKLLHSYIRKIYDQFGPKRMFWGTDLSRLTCTYREGLTFFSEEIPWLTSEDKEWIMGKAICEWHGWDLPKQQGVQ